MTIVPLPGFSRYSVSQNGDVFGPGKGRYGSSVTKLRQLPHIKSGGRPSGYLYVTVWRNSKPTRIRVHKAVLLAFVGPPPTPRHQCRHLDGNPANNHLSNLVWGLPVENCQDRDRHGRVWWGTEKPDNKLTEAQVLMVREDQRASRVVGAEYGVSHTTVLKIRRGEKWSRLS